MKAPRRARAVLVGVALLASIVGVAGDAVRLIDAVRAGDRDAVRGLLRAKVLVEPGGKNDGRLLVTLTHLLSQSPQTVGVSAPFHGVQS